MASFLKRIPPLSPDREQRERTLWSALDSCVYACACILEVQHHLGAKTIMSAITAKSRGDRKWRDDPNDRRSVTDFIAEIDKIRKSTSLHGPGLIPWQNDQIFRLTEPSNVDHERQLAEAAEGISYATRLLKEGFPGYADTVEVDLKQGSSVADEVKQTLRRGVTVIELLKLVPEYWADEEYNRTALLLSFHQIFGSYEAEMSFLRMLRQEKPEEVATFLKRLDEGDGPIASLLEPSAVR